MKYGALGYNSFEDYFNYFLETTLPTNKTYSFFVDWEKIKNNIKKHKEKIHILNSLREEKEDTIEVAFMKLSKKYPEVISALPILIAERAKKGKIMLYDLISKDFVEFKFNKKKYTDEEIFKIKEFCKNTGVLSLLISVKDLCDYLLGVEVGLDSHARKNRGGRIFETMVENILSKLDNAKYQVKVQDNSISLYTSGKKKINRHDFIIYKYGKPHAIVEVNFFNTLGSKPDSVVGNYINFAREARKKKIKFIWVSDGPAWKKGKNYLRKAMKEIDYVVNYRILDNFLDKIMK